MTDIRNLRTRPWLGLFAVLTALIMNILDSTIVTVAAPSIQESLGGSYASIQWLSAGYTLALATVIPITGWAADRFGTKRLYMLSLALFLCGSILSGLAWSACGCQCDRAIELAKRSWR